MCLLSTKCWHVSYLQLKEINYAFIFIWPIHNQYSNPRSCLCHTDMQCTSQFLDAVTHLYKRIFLAVSVSIRVIKGQ